MVMVQVLLAADMVSGIWKQGNVLIGVEFFIPYTADLWGGSGNPFSY